MPLKVAYYCPWWTVGGGGAPLRAWSAGSWAGSWTSTVSPCTPATADRLIRAYLGPRRAGRPADAQPVSPASTRTTTSRCRSCAATVRSTSSTWRSISWPARISPGRTARRRPSPPRRCHAGSFRLGYRDTAEYGQHRDHKDLALSPGHRGSPSRVPRRAPTWDITPRRWSTFPAGAVQTCALGWWLGNPGPARQPHLQHPGPRRFAPSSLFAEAFGLTDNDHPYVYLTDGGHFENLGLYEMVLRRCRYIVVSDGGPGRRVHLRGPGQTPCPRSASTSGCRSSSGRSRSPPAPRSR